MKIEDMVTHRTYWEEVDTENHPRWFQAYECAAEIAGDMGLSDADYKPFAAAFIKGYELAREEQEK